MEKIWLKNYPAGVPAEIDVEAYRSVVDVFEQSVAQYADRPAFSNFGVTITYRQLEESTLALAAYLQKDLGLNRGDRIAIMMPNLLQNPIAIFAALRAGLTVVNTNPLYTPRELEHQLNDSGARAIIIVENFANTLEAIVNKTQIEHVLLTKMGDMLGAAKGLVVNFVVKYVKRMVPAYHLPGALGFKAALARGASLQLAPPILDPGEIAFLQYTGGTTGVAKGAMLTHRNMVANLQQASAWLAPWTEEGKEVIITALPLYHIFSLTANCLTFMKIGGLNHLITNPRDMAGFVKELRSVRFSTITGVNTLFNGLLNTPGFSDIDFSTLRLTIGGGMAVQAAVAEEWKNVTGVPIIEAYGLTETAPAVSINRLDLEAHNGSIGLPVPSTEISLCDDEREVGVGEPGELCVRGPQVMQGYWQRPEDTAEVLDGDGWLRTGDVAEIDADGYLRIVDRKKDMILVSGFNVYPNEIEDVVAMHPGVLEVGAIGVPDERTGEAVRVVVVRKDPALDEASLIAFCREQLTGYKVPRQVEFRDELPKSNVGKILRRELREPASN